MLLLYTILSENPTENEVFTNKFVIEKQKHLLCIDAKLFVDIHFCAPKNNLLKILERED